MKAEDIQSQFTSQELPPPQSVQSAVMQEKVEAEKPVELIRIDGNTSPENMIKESQVINGLCISDHKLQILNNEFHDGNQYGEKYSPGETHEEEISANDEEKVKIDLAEENEPISCGYLKEKIMESEFNIDIADKIKSALR